MRLVVNRHPSTRTETIGDLLVDGEMYCHVLEDPIREIPGLPVEKWKIPGDSAIPAGLYPVEITWSARFKEDLPLVMRVPGFAGIRIHAGNSHADTEGCLLVGDWTGGSFIRNSRKRLEGLMAMLEVANIAKRNISLETINPD